MAVSLADYLLFILGKDQNLLTGKKSASQRNLTFIPYQTLYNIVTPHLYHESSVRHAVNDLEKQGVIEKLERNTQLYLTPTDKGYNQVAEEYLKHLQTTKMNQPTEWWQVLFDVPEKKRSLRDQIRTELTTIGFKNWKRSVYLYPVGSEQDAHIKKIIEKPEWQGYVTLMKISEIVYGTTNEELYDLLWDEAVTNVSIDELLMGMNETIDMLSKRAINKYQRKAYHEKAQVLCRDAFEYIAALSGLGINVHVEKDDLKKLIQALDTLLSLLSTMIAEEA